MKKIEQPIVKDQFEPSILLKCPYITKTYNAYVNGNIQSQVQEHTDCIKWDCACWQDGKCTRK